LIKGGVECIITSEIPKSIGLGYYSSLQIGLFKAAKKIFRLKLTDLEMIEIAHKIEQEFIGQISNKANYFCSFFGKENCLMFVDLRVNEHKCLKFNNDEFSFIIFDTNLTIKNSETICRTRIDECSVGVKALRLYIWGIKNLRDVDIEFLQKHINMIPQLVYKRCVYNVTEKQRVLNAAKFIRTKKYNEFGSEIYDSFNSLVKDYELNYPELTKLVDATKSIKDIFAAKSISCTPAKCIYTIVKSKSSDNIIRTVKNSIGKTAKTELTAYKLCTSSGAHFINQ
jgi:galactokinase